MNTFKTPKGTSLPILSLKGKDYLQVAHRLVWFREEHPDWTIETKVERIENNSALGSAVIKDQTGRVIATAHKYEDAKGFSDFIEKSETGAVGRALAMCGYGTQFTAHELDEGERIADAPVSKEITARVVTTTADPGDFQIPFGKNAGKRIRDIKASELESYINWLEADAKKKGVPVKGAAMTFIQEATKYLSSLGDKLPAF